MKKIDLLILINVLILLFSPLIAYNGLLVEGNISKAKIPSGWSWTMTEVLSTESTGFSFSPSLVADQDGNIHVIWSDSSDYAPDDGLYNDIFYKRWVASANTWTSTEVVSFSSTKSAFSPEIAVDSSGNLHVVWSDSTDDLLSSGTDSDIFYRSWNASLSAWSPIELVSSESTGSASFIALGIDNSGNIHVAWQDTSDYDSAGSDWDIFYKRRAAASGTWTSAEVVSTDSTSNSVDPSIAIDDFGNAHLVWDDWTDVLGSGADHDIFYKVKFEANTSWSTTELVSEGSTTDVWTPPTIDLDSSQNIHIVWGESMDYGTNGVDQDIIYRKRSVNGTWGSIEVVSTEGTDPSSSSVHKVDSSGNVHVVWHSNYNYPGSGTDVDIFYKVRNSTTDSWDTIELISEGTESSYDPVIAIDNYSFVHFVWTDDTEYDGSGTDRDIFYRKLGGTIPESPTPSSTPTDPNPFGLPISQSTFNLLMIGAIVVLLGVIGLLLIKRR